MRISLFLIASFAVACAGSPPPAPKPATPKVAVATPEVESTPPAEPLAMQSVTLTVKDGFADVGLGRVQPKLWSEEELVRRLPLGAKREVEALLRARKASREASRDASLASHTLHACRDCRERAQLQRKSDAARKASNGARQALDKAIDRADRQLEKQLGSAKAAPEVGVALARIRAGRADLSPSAAHWFRYGEADASDSGLVTLRQAAELAGPDTEVGRLMRYELLNRLWGKDDGQAVRQVVAELAGTAPPEWRAELEFHAAAYDALDGDHAKAAAGFERALAAHVPGSSVTRKTLALAALVARYRSLDFELTLSAAFTAFDEAAKPEPRAPEPPAPPKPPAPTKPKPIARTNKRVGVKIAQAALRQHAEFGMIGLLSTSAFGGGRFDEDEIARLAADSIERLDRDPTKLSGSAEGRARVLSVLAIRALYRNQVHLAQELAEASRALGPLAGTHGALNVLEALAFRDNDPEQAAKIAKVRATMNWDPKAWTGSDAEPDERNLTEVLKKARGGAPATKDKDTPAPPVAQNVLSAVRACVEPVRMDLPEATGTGKERRIATLTLSAQVFSDGKVQFHAGADHIDGSMRQVLACLKSMGPRALAHAPSSVTARVTLSDSVRRVGSAFGGLWGDQIGESFGAGGLGFSGIGKGGGGVGDGIGIGSIGRGQNGGGGTVGRPPAKKPPAKSHKTP